VRSALKRLASEAPLEVLVESGDIARSAERETFERFSATLGSRARDEFLSLWGAIIQEYHRVRLQGLKNFGIGHTALSRALAVRNELRSRLKITGGYVSLQGNLSDAYRDEVQRHIWSANLDQMFYRCGRDDQGKIVYKPFGKRGTQAKKELTRMLSQDSVVKEAPFVCGEAINIGVLDDTGKQSYRRVIVMSTAIQRSWLVAKGTSLQAVQAQVRDALQRTPDHLPRRQKAPLDQKFFRPEAFQGSRNKTFGRR
jgi:hypothetical protein